MQLAAGDKLGPYEIGSLLGKGGMGEVWLATDTRLGRHVAIKVSAIEFNDRFEREARAISSLNHPNICTLHDVGPSYLVMEFVEGPTLASLLAHGPLPLETALRYATQIADALAAAHAKGVIHRDLKPGNIIVAKTGIKVLDFGLAKLTTGRHQTDSAMHNALTAAEPITGAGAIVGTLHYMSPEQVEAKPVDERSDIFSFGAIFYEMITGVRAFGGDSAAGVLAAVLKDQPPPMSRSGRIAPRSVERIVRKCLEKHPDDRWQSARDLKPTLELIDLDEPAPAATPPGKPWQWPAAVAAALLLPATLAWIFWPKPQAPERLTRFEISLPEGAQIAPLDFYLRVSPDATKIAFTTGGDNGGIWVRDLAAVSARLLPGTAHAIAPIWSPDSRSLAYGAGLRMMKVDAAGGPPLVLCDSATPVGSGFWTTSGDIVFGGRGTGALQRVPAAGGVPAPVTVLGEDELFHSLPSLLPGERRFLYLRQGKNRGIFAGLLNVKPADQPAEAIAPSQFAATFVASAKRDGGYLFFVRDTTLMAQPFDLKALRVTGDAVPVVPQIGLAGANAYFSISASGVMAYQSGRGSKYQLDWLDTPGGVPRREGVFAATQSVSMSPDESHIALARNETDNAPGAYLDIWLLDLARNVESRLTTGRTVATSPFYGAVWSPDGKELAYMDNSRRGTRAIVVKDAGGATEGRVVHSGQGAGVITDWTRDGRYLIYSGGMQQIGIYTIPVAGGEPQPVPGLETNANGRISPDGRWIAYNSPRSGQTEVYVRPFAEPDATPAPAGPVIQISQSGGAAPYWREDGTELFFWAGTGDLMSVKIQSSKESFHPESPVATGIRSTNPVMALSRSGRFLLGHPADGGAPTPITVVTNWEAALKQR